MVPVGDRVFPGDGVVRQIDDRKVPREETIGLELLAGDVECGPVRDGCSDAAGNEDLSAEGRGVGNRGGDFIELEDTLL